MNELIAMWTARAEQENNHEVALAIMQCVGELKASQEPKETLHEQFKKAMRNDSRVNVFGEILDADNSECFEIQIVLPKYIPMSFTAKQDDNKLMRRILTALLEDNDTLALAMLHGVLI